MKLRDWYSVFLAADGVPSPAAMLQAIRPRIVRLAADFDFVDGEWQTGRFTLAGVWSPAILVERLRRGDEGFAARVEGFEDRLSELNQEPHRDLVLAHIRHSEQVINLAPFPIIEIGATVKARACEQVCGSLARTGEGLIQVFQEGFFSAEGESLVPYCPRHKLRTR